MMTGAAIGLAMAAVPTLAADEMPEGVGATGDLAWSEVFPGIWRARLGEPEAYTPVSSRLIPPALDGMRLLPAPNSPPIGKIGGEITNRGCMVYLPLQPREQVYGFGLQLLSFAQRGKKKTIRVNADPKNDTGDSHAPVPFYVTTRGYGVLVDSCRQVEFYCGDARPKPVARAEGAVGTGSVNTPESTRNLPADAAGTISVEVPRARGVDVYVFAGPAMLQAVQRYNLFSGGGVAPPTWGLGFWYRAEGQASDGGVLKLAREFRERNLPCDVMGLEPGWQTHAYSCSFRWDPVRFPMPKAFVEEMTKLGFKTNLWEHAFTHPTAPLFESLLPYTGDYGVWGGLVPDFAGEPGRRVFGDFHGKNLIDLGVSGFKLDECDGSDNTGGWSYPDMSRFPSGVDGEQMHSVFGLRYQHAIWKQFLDRGRPTYGLVRSSGALAAPYPFVLYSDLYDHRQFIRALVNSGFAGLLWCPEVRDASTEEDLIRRLESVVFSPLAMVNAWYIKSPPWKQIDRLKNNAGEFAEGWEALEERCRVIIGWRMQLAPYLRSAFERYATDGTPPFRALILDHPEDASLVVVDDEYMVGDRMLVAPLFAGEAERKITLPSGRWHDFWTGAEVQGGRSFMAPSSTEKIPVFVKGGSVFPVAAIGASTEAASSRELTVRVYGDGSLPWRLQGRPGVELELRWDAKARRGTVKQSLGAAHGFSISGWQQMGGEHV